MNRSPTSLVDRRRFHARQSFQWIVPALLGCRAILALGLSHPFTPPSANGQTVVSPSGDERLAHWPAWRGPAATGVSLDADPPVEWSETQNVRWKVELPGRGHSTPILWGDRVFLTTAIPVGPTFPPRYSQAEGTHDGVPVTQKHQFVGLALDRSTGQIIWQRTLHEAIPHEGGHVTGSLASHSATTDGKYVFLSFGSYGVYCLRANDGQLVWQRDFGPMNTKHGHGEGSSPVLHGETVVINWDHEGQSFVEALHTQTGQTRWKVQRPELTSWSTPIVVSHDNRQQLIVPGTERIRAYDLETGELIWQCSGLSSNIVASPVAGGGIVYLGSSYESRAFLAIRLAGSRGDVSDSDQVLWRRSRGTPYVPSPLLYDESVYYLTHYQGILTRVHGPTGVDAPGATRLGPIRDVYASPVGASNRIYVTDLLGTTVVVAHGEIPRLIAVNRLDETFCASAALAQNQLFLRGLKFLYCLQEMPLEGR